MTTRDFQTRKPISILFSYFKPHRGLFILDLVCATIVALIDLAFPLVTRRSMYDLLPNQQYQTFFLVMAAMMAALSDSMPVRSTPSSLSRAVSSSRIAWRYLKPYSTDGEI